MRHVEVNVLRPARGLRPGAAEGGVQLRLRVQVQAQGRQVSAQGQANQVRVCLGSADECLGESKQVSKMKFWDMKVFVGK